MRIVHIFTSFGIGGIETMLVDIINEQVNYGEIHLIILNRKINNTLLEKISSKVNIHLLNRKNGSKNPVYLFRFNFLLIKLHPDVIHCHAGEIIKYIFLKNRYKIHLTVHTTNVGGSSLYKYDKIFAISKTVKNDLKKRLNIHAILVYNGIPVQNIKIKKKYNSDIFNIICVGRLLHKIKGQDLLINAMDNCVNKRGLSNIVLDFIGEGDSLPYLKNRVRSYNLQKNIQFLGLKDRDYIYSHLKNYDLLVQPSIYEGFGLTVAEAMAAGVPVLVSNIEGPMEIIHHGEYGSFFQKGNEYDLADKIEKAYAVWQTKIRDEKPEKALEYAKTNFDVKITAQEYYKNY